MDNNELNEILRSGKFNLIIGKVENDWFECKQAPYPLNNPKEKQELVKDVTGLANSTGGIILLGIRTEKSQVHFGDEVKEIRSFAQDLVNVENYHNIT